MKIKEVSVSAGATVNTGNFNSVRLEVGAVADVQDGEKASDVLKQLSENMRAMLVVEMKKMLPEKKEAE